MTTREPFSRSAYAPHVGMYASQSMPASRGSGFSRFVYLFAWSLIGVAAVAGGLFSLYRNDVLLSEARQRGLEAPYLLLERKIVGTPGWGTPRSMSSSAPVAGAVIAQSTSALLPSVVTPSAVAAPSVVADAAAKAASAPAASPEAKTQPSEPAQTSTSEGLKITSLDSLAPLPAGRSAPPTVTQAPAQRTQRAVAVSEPKATAPVRPVRESEPKAVSARAVRESEPKPAARAVRESEPASKPVKAAAVAEKAPPKAAPKAPPPPPADDSPLKAAIRSAIIKDQSSKK